MGIVSIQTVQSGLVDVLPSISYINTTDPLATALVSGYLNKEVANGVQFSIPCLCILSTKETPTSAYRVGTFQISHSGANWSIVSASSPAAGVVTLPTILNHIATYSDTGGTLAEDAATAINGGNIQAGLSGTAGFLASFPLTAAKGSLRLTAVANTGDTLVTISNAAHGQASVYSIPDSGASTANLLISKLTGTQHITVGSLEVDAGNLIAGISGTAGTFIAFPATAANGTMIIAAGNAGGAFNTTITSGTIGQSTVYTVPDIGAATGGVVVSTAAVRMKSVAAAAVAGGAASNVVTDTFCTSGSCVVASWNDSTNAVTLQKVTAGNGSFTVLCSADPGASHLNYIITK